MFSIFSRAFNVHETLFLLPVQDLCANFVGDEGSNRALCVLIMTNKLHTTKNNLLKLTDICISCLHVALLETCVTVCNFMLKVR